VDYPTSGDDRLMATLAYVLSLCFPIAAPLLIFLVKRRSRFVAFHALQALFIELGLAVLGVAVVVLTWLLGMLGPLALLLAPLHIIAWCTGIAAWLYKIIGAIQANSGTWYRIPFVWPYAERIA
jgi:hypothetical protein